MKALVRGPDRPGYESWLHHFQLCDLGQRPKLHGASFLSSLSGEVSASQGKCEA